MLTLPGDEAANDLRVKGAASDTVNLSNTTFGTTATTMVIDGITYDLYTSGDTDITVRLLIDQDVTVTGVTTIAPVELAAIELSSNTGGFVINGVSAGDQSGRSVSAAGDVNGDGLADLIVGAWLDDPNGSYSGASFVVFGKSDGTVVELSTVEAGTGGFAILGVSAGDFSGRSVSGAGDVNGDGLADLIVGSYVVPNGNAIGASFVVFGKSDGLAVELSAVETGIGGFVINGVSADDKSGWSVSSAGDVNGDGFADLIVGARYDDPNGNKSGASFVIFGGQGTSATVGTSGADTLTGDASANQLVAGQGDDTLIGNGGADVLRGGAGDDVLEVSDTSFASIDGGTGLDTLKFSLGGETIDMSNISNLRTQSIEKLDITGTASNQMVFDANTTAQEGTGSTTAAAATLPATNTIASQTLTINGTGTDSVVVTSGDTAFTVAAAINAGSGTTGRNRAGQHHGYPG